MPTESEPSGVPAAEPPQARPHSAGQGTPSLWASAPEARRPLPGWLPLALGGLLIVTGLLLSLIPWGTVVPWLSVTLHSMLAADYSPDLSGARLPPVRLALAAEALADQGYLQTAAAPGLGLSATPGDILATLQTGLLTPIPTVTPRPGETLFPLITLTPSP
ncbi:MAG TPA: hypothetical protein VN363_03895, partial [Anaerolineales bacterium]|nr:hypothetical protein [Anaerolineales bacterium]